MAPVPSTKTKLNNEASRNTAPTQMAPPVSLTDLVADVPFSHSAFFARARCLPGVGDIRYSGRRGKASQGGNGEKARCPTNEGETLFHTRARNM